MLTQFCSRALVTNFSNFTKIYTQKITFIMFYLCHKRVHVRRSLDHPTKSCITQFCSSNILFNIDEWDFVISSPVALELFLDRGEGKTGGARPGAPKSRTRNKGLRRNWSVFCPKIKRSPKKRSSSGSGAYSCPKNGSRYRSQGGKSSPGGQNNSRGAAAPCPLFSTPMFPPIV